MCSSDLSDRVNWMRGLGKKELVALWNLADGRDVPLAYLHGAEGEVIIHEGQNSLLAFNRFQKRVMLRGGRVQGYNEQAMAWLTGPGHFYCQAGEGAAYFDYTVNVADAPEVFPPVKPNDAGLSKLVYGGMIDKLRRVSERSVIGAAFRGGKQTGDYFMLQKP